VIKLAVSELTQTITDEDSRLIATPTFTYNAMNTFLRCINIQILYEM